jgi:collagenase-like PrtC family protease
MAKIFSIPINPKLSETQFIEFVQFCDTYKDYISDLYFTCRIAPFTQDAMGDVFIADDSAQYMIDMALFIQEKTGITASATFNNNTIRPTQENLDLWIQSFKPLYEAGVRLCTLPFNHWLLTGQIQKEFPELEVRSSILMDTKTATDVYNVVTSGFHSVCIDRALMRDHDTIKTIAKIKRTKPFKLVLLANEGCLGKCPVMAEHYQYNNTRTVESQYFNNPISRVSCPKWDFTNKAVVLKTADIPAWKEDWDEFLSIGVDIFKMHGRENVKKIYETMEIVRNYAENREKLYDVNLGINAADEAKWRKIIKTCKFECWSCNFCDRKAENRLIEKATLIANLLVTSVNSDFETSVPGISSPRVDKLLNELGKISTSYLEVGCLGGRTFSSVLSGNTLTAYAVDNWKEGVVSENNEHDITVTKEDFVSNILPHKGENLIKVFNCDFINVNKTDISGVDLFLYDGDHSYESTKLAVEYFASTFADECILVFDDANWDGVVDGAIAGIEAAGLTVQYDKKLLNSIEDKAMWWNGLFIALVNKPKAGSQL